MKWVETTLKAVSLDKPQYGANASSVDSSGKRPRFVRITDIDDNGVLRPDCRRESDLENIESYRLKDGDFLFARTGSVGRTYVYSELDGDCIFAGYLIRFRLNRDLIHPRFLFHYSKSSAYRHWVATKQRVAIQANINGSEYASLRFPLPTLREQGRIVELLEQADMLRRQRFEADQLANCIIPALFCHVFGEPTTNPKQWPTSPLHKLADFISGATPSKEIPEFWDGRIPWVSPKDMKRSELHDAIDHVSDKALADTNLKLIPANTTLIVVRGMILAHTVPVCLARVPVTINQDMKALAAKGDATAEYLQWALLTQHHGLLRLVTTAAHGTKKLDTDALGALEIPIPPSDRKDLIQKWTTIVREQQVAARQRADCGEAIERLWEVMLHRAFTGELTAKWREAHLKELLVEMEHQAKLLRTDGKIN